MKNSELVEQLWEDDKSPVLTNRAAGRIEELENENNQLLGQLAEVEAQLDALLSRCYVREGGYISMPCGFSKITEEDKRTSIINLSECLK